MERYVKSSVKRRSRKLAVRSLSLLFIVLLGLFILFQWQNTKISPLSISKDLPNSLIDEINSYQISSEEDHYSSQEYYFDAGATNNGQSNGDSSNGDLHSNISQDTRKGVIRLNDTVSSVLYNNGISREEIGKLLDLAKIKYDLRRVSVGRKYAITRDESGRLLQFNLELDDENLLDVQRSDLVTPNFNLEVQKLGLEKRRVNLYGEIDDSLYSAVIKAGGKPQLSIALAELFAWQIDFLTDIKRGDKFKIFYEELCRDGEFIKYGQILAAEVVNDGEIFQAFYYEDPAGHKDYYNLNGESLRKAFLKSPLSFTRISSTFTANRHHPILKTVLPHFGVDYAAPVGTPVVSVADGEVIFAGTKGGYGNFVKIDHFSDYSTGYAHLSRFAKDMRRGASIKQGQVLGYVGATGLATGPHLDYRIWHREKYVDPLNVKLPNSKPIPAKFKKDFQEKANVLLAGLKSDGTVLASTKRN